MLDLKSEIIPKILEETMPDKLSWAQIYEALLEQFPGLTTTKNTQFQFSAAPLEADWNQLPTYPYNWVNKSCHPGPYYIESGAIDDNFYLFIVNLEPYQPTRDPTYVDLTDHQIIYLNKYNDINKEANQAFKDWKANNPSHETDYPKIKSYDDWIDSNFGAGYDSQIKSIKSQLDDYNSRLAEYASEPTVRKTLISNFNDPQNIITVDGVKRHKMSIEPDLNKKIEQWRAGTYANSIKIDTSTATQDENVWTVHGEAGANYNGFIDIKADGSAFLKEDVRNDKKFSLVIEIKDVELFKFNRENWFNENILDSLRNGPFINKHFTAEDYFGEKGSLSMIPINVLVGFGITASLTLSNKTYKSYEKYWETNLEVRVGPFKINVGAHGSQITTNSTDDTTTITFNGTNDIEKMNPQVIGVLCNVHMIGVDEEKLQIESVFQVGKKPRLGFYPDEKEPHIHVNENGITFTNTRHKHKDLEDNSEVPRCSAVREVLSELGSDERSEYIRNWIKTRYINSRKC